MQNFSLAGWYNIFQNNFLCDFEWCKLAETCKEINKIFQYFLAKDICNIIFLLYCICSE